jgi:hypothetical protein
MEYIEYASNLLYMFLQSYMNKFQTKSMPTRIEN